MSLPKYDLGQFLISHVELTLEELPDGRVRCTAAYKIRDAYADGAPETYGATTCEDRPDRIDELVVLALKTALTHELEEWLRRDGEWRYDPHGRRGVDEVFGRGEPVHGGSE